MGGTEMMRYQVTIKTGYNELEFEFEDFESAKSFADTAIQAVKPYIDSNGVVTETKATISMTKIELNKEDSKDELELQA